MEASTLPSSYRKGCLAEGWAQALSDSSISCVRGWDVAWQREAPALGRYL